MSAPADDAFEAAMRQFRAEFAAQLPDRLRQMRDALAAFRAQPGDAARLRELHLVVHKLVGAAGTFRMPALAQAAQAAEDEILALTEREDRGAADLEPLAAHVAAVESAAGRS